MWDNRQGDVEEVGVSVGFERFENVIFLGLKNMFHCS
jgi:hypothetical protein